MIGFARFTAIVFLVLGIIVFFTGFFLVLDGLLGPSGASTSAPSLLPLRGLSAFAGAIAGGVVAFQGLLLAAIGEALWLMARMSEHLEQSTDYIAALADRFAPEDAGPAD